MKRLLQAAKWLADPLAAVVGVVLAAVVELLHRWR